MSVARKVLKRLVKFFVYDIPGEFIARRLYSQLLKDVKRRLPVEHKKLAGVKNILQINQIDNIGGAARIAYLLGKRLNDLGYNSKMLVGMSFCKDDNIELLKQEDSFRQELLKSYQDSNGWQDLFNLSSLNIKNLENFKNSDLIHFHNQHLGYFSPFALPEITALKPCIWTLHDMHAITGHCAHSFDCERWITGCRNCPAPDCYPPIKKDASSLLWKTKKIIYEKSRLTVVCPSLWLKEKVEKSILKAQDIRLIYNGIDETIFKGIDKEQARDSLNLPQDKIILLFNAQGGKKNPWKGGEYLDLVYQEMQNNENILFLNIGGEKTQYKSDNWLDVAYVSDEKTLSLYYSAADLFIYPSLADTFGLVVAEALACGTTVITFKTGGIPEIVDHLKTGYIAEYKDSSDFINGIKFFIDNPDLRKNAGMEGRVKVENNFTLKKMTDSYIKLYSEFVM